MYVLPFRDVVNLNKNSIIVSYFSILESGGKLAISPQTVQNRSMSEKLKLIMSMTGYGRSEVEIEERRLVCEIRTVNHRFLEISLKLPPGWVALEDQIRRQVKQLIRRGRVDVFLSVASDQPRERSLQFDWALLEAYLQTQQQIAARYDLRAELSMADLFHKSELWQFAEQAEDVKQFVAPLKQVLSAACADVVQMRQTEGRVLANDLADRCERLQATLAQIKKSAPQAVEQYRRRLQQRLADWLDAGQLDPERLMAEVALFADKADIAEECTRLASHLQQFQAALALAEPVGRRLDFLLQEMQRELNTIGSKANHEQISYWVIQGKSELEKMKEQVQNIE
jgi:uncharacterized protein (TIGR00255 family)